jgi:toxin-antitoxin system PIN domain toxin
VIALDTNFLVYAHRQDSPFFRSAFDALAELAAGSAPWSIPWPCIHEFLAIVTNPRIYKPPTPIGLAIQQIDFWRESPSLQLVGELEGHWTELAKMLCAGKIVGGAVHDARIAAICVEHGVKEFWTIDRDFSRLAGVHAVNPLNRRRSQS